MKKYIVAGILCLSSFCYSQTEDAKKLEDYKKAKAIADAEFGMGEGFTCEKGLKDAENDFNKGMYNSYIFGFVVERKGEEGLFDSFYEKYLHEKYSINIRYKGCVISEYSRCYSEAMKKLIYEKFGSDIYLKAKIEAQKLFAQKNEH